MHEQNTLPQSASTLLSRRVLVMLWLEYKPGGHASACNPYPTPGIAPHLFFFHCMTGSSTLVLLIYSLHDWQQHTIAAHLSVGRLLLFRYTSIVRCGV